jgi:hypothetical protein
VLLNKLKINTYKKVATILEFIMNNSAVFKSDEIPQMVKMKQKYIADLVVA